ncbi:uncharacterized protein V1516DRAFT_664647 [Lipomyces oligophaga]|uniref:uncharacterized protein n=1 Tax=Lipomyces oligophaga TaxID=45792 RepID=UPI0034CD619C
MSHSGLRQSNNHHSHAPFKSLASGRSSATAAAAAAVAAAAAANASPAPPTPLLYIDNATIKDVTELRTQLRSPSEAARRLAVYRVLQNIGNRQVAKWFIDLGGFDDIRKLVFSSDPATTIAYALTILGKLHDSGFGWTTPDEDVLERIFYIISAESQFNLLRSAVTCAVSIVRYFADHISTPLFQGVDGYRRFLSYSSKYPSLLPNFAAKIRFPEKQIVVSMLTLINSLFRGILGLNLPEPIDKEEYCRANLFPMPMQILGSIGVMEQIFQMSFDPLSYASPEINAQLVLFRQSIETMMRYRRRKHVDTHAFMSHRIAVEDITTFGVKLAASMNLVRPSVLTPPTSPTSATSPTTGATSTSSSVTPRGSAGYNIAPSMELMILEKMGFLNPTSPSVDFEAAGWLGLVDLAIVANESPADLTRILRDQWAQQEFVYRFPLAKVSFKISQLMFSHLTSCPHPPAPLPGHEPPPDVASLYLQWKTIHKALLIAFDRFWTASRASWWFSLPASSTGAPAAPAVVSTASSVSSTTSTANGVGAGQPTPTISRSLGPAAIPASTSKNAVADESDFYRVMELISCLLQYTTTKFISDPSIANDLTGFIAGVTYKDIRKIQSLASDPYVNQTEVTGLKRTFGGEVLEYLLCQRIEALRNGAWFQAPPYTNLNSTLSDNAPVPSIAPGSPHRSITASRRFTMTRRIELDRVSFSTAASTSDQNSISTTATSISAADSTWVYMRLAKNNKTLHWNVYYVRRDEKFVPRLEELPGRIDIANITRISVSKNLDLFSGSVEDIMETPLKNMGPTTGFLSASGTGTSGSASASGASGAGAGAFGRDVFKITFHGYREEDVATPATVAAAKETVLLQIYPEGHTSMVEWYDGLSALLAARGRSKPEAKQLAKTSISTETARYVKVISEIAAPVQCLNYDWILYRPSL